MILPAPRPMKWQPSAPDWRSVRWARIQIRVVAASCLGFSFLQQVPQFVKAPDLVGLDAHEALAVPDDREVT